MRYVGSWRFTVLLVVFVAALTSAACRNDAPSQPPATIGEIGETLYPYSFLNGERAEEEASIGQGAEIQTDESGVVVFAVPTFRTECRLGPSTLLATTSGDWPLLRLRSGQMVCGVTPQHDAWFSDVRGRFIRMRSAASFHVAVNPKGAGIEVFDGTVETMDPRTERSDLVEQGEDLGWTHDGRLNPDWKLPPLPDNMTLPTYSPTASNQ
jgi:hypothetical protein